MSQDDLHEAIGPQLLLAGPGTGKTYRLARRIKYLVEEGTIDPETVTMLTFSSAAAAEMRIRISDASRPETFVAVERRPRQISTIHSLGYSIVRRAAVELGLPDRPAVVTEDAVANLVLGDAAQLENLDRAEAQHTGQCRQIGQCAEDDSPKCRVCKRYCLMLRACGAVDHDDQVLLAMDVLDRIPEIRKEYEDKCQHLLVDEYQDINHAQFRLIGALSRESREGLFVVGDDDQSIYGWRGASPEFIRNFERDLGAAGLTKSLTHCYRCNPHVAQAALSVVKAFDASSLDKGKQTFEQPDGPLVTIHNVPSNLYEEIEIQKIIEGSGSRQVLVLYPNKRIARGLVDRLRKRRIPFIGPAPEPGDGLWLLNKLGNWAQDTDDNLALRVCLEGVLSSGCLSFPGPRSRSAAKIAERAAGLARVASLWEIVLAGQGSLWDALRTSSDDESPVRDLRDCCCELLAAKDAPVHEFFATACRLLCPWTEVQRALEEIEDWVDSLDRPRGESQVRVMSLQASKGLEAEVVCVMGVEEGIIPRGDVNLEEQSRLLYVAMTRAKQELHLFTTRKRPAHMSFVQGGGTYAPPDPSRFIAAIPGKHVEIKKSWASKKAGKKY